MYKLSLLNGKMSNKSNQVKKYTIVKKIAKHGSQSIIVIPRILESQLKPGTITQVTISIIEPELNSEGGKDGS